jgi:hypothetical protein
MLKEILQKKSPHILDKSVNLNEQEFYKEKKTDKIIRLAIIGRLN